MTPSPLKTTLALLCSDSLCLFLSLGLALVGRALLGGLIIFAEYLPLLSIWPILIFYFFVAKLYPGILLLPQEELRKCIQGTSFAFACVWLLLFFHRPQPAYSRAAMLGAWFLACVFLPLARHLMKKKWAARPWWGEPLLVCGQTRPAEELCHHLAQTPALGLKPVGIVAFPPDAPSAGASGAPVPILNMDDALAATTRGPQPYALFLEHGESDESRHALMRFSEYFKRALFLLPSFTPLGMWVSAANVGGVFALEVNQKLLDPCRQKVKRCLDLVLLACAAPLLLPVMGVLAFLIWREDGRPVFYSQERLGKGGQPFRIWKFRTMVREADKKLADCLAADPALKKEWEETQKLRHDPRVTKIGHFLRCTSLDELPQLWNVLNGTMSLVGPRPIVHNEIKKYGAAYDLYIKVRPGMTGYWQVSGRSAISYTTRLQLDCFYIRNWSVWFDLYILCATPAALLKPDTAC